MINPIALALALGPGIEVAVKVPVPDDGPVTTVTCAVDDSEELDEVDLVPKTPPSTPPKIAATSAMTMIIRIHGLKPQIFRFVFVLSDSGGVIP